MTATAQIVGFPDWRPEQDLIFGKSFHGWHRYHCAIPDVASDQNAAAEGYSPTSKHIQHLKAGWLRVLAGLGYTSEATL